MGHEFSHALDDMGSKYDEYGNMRNWWTPQDRAMFNRKINDVVKQYEDVARMDGIVFDARIGVGEDLADISGMALVEEYLFHFLEYNKVLPIVRLLSFKSLYIYSAIQSRQQIKKSSLAAELKNNPHPPEKYRCNCPLSRLSVFREIYGITSKDKMWWHNTDTIW
jgi:putative endopeptidase